MLADKIVEAVRSVIGDAPAALHEPLMIGNEQKYVAECISKNQVTQGEYIERFEQMLCDFTGAKYAVATCNATCAIHIALVVLGVQTHYPLGIPSLTFIATANAALQVTDYIQLGESKDLLSIQTHLLGHIEREDCLLADAAQALGSFGKSKFEEAVFSFNGNKIITTGGGGAFITNNAEMASNVRHLIAQARIPHSWEIKHDDIGFNYRMPNINAALGCAQMEQLPYILKAKRALAEEYIKAFDSIDGVTVWKEPEETKSNYWLVAIILDDPSEQIPILQTLHNAGYIARMLPTPLHLLPMYKDCPHTDLSRSEDLWRRTICLPSSPKLGMQYA